MYQDLQRGIILRNNKNKRQSQLTKCLEFNNLDSYIDYYWRRFSQFRKQSSVKISIFWNSKALSKITEDDIYVL